MVRNAIFRLPFVRAFIPRISRPILPLSRRPLTQPGAVIPRGRTGSRLFHHFPARLTSSSPHESDTPKLPPNASLSQRLKHLIKTYGWYTLGVYFFLTVADFTVAFAAVNILGAEHVSRVVTSVKEFFLAYIPSRPPEPGREDTDRMTPHAPGSGHEGLYAMLLLAYTIHKTLFMPVRVGLTAVLTPRLVTWLRSRGWAGGAGTKRAVQEMRERIRETRDRS